MGTRKLRIDLDERTDHLSNEALFCRTFSHKWTLRAQSPTRFRELIRQGLTEYERYCDNGCGATWRQLWDLRRKEIVENERRYPTGGEYLMPTGTGRLPRGEAFAANFARQNPAFV